VIAARRRETSNKKKKENFNLAMEEGEGKKNVKRGKTNRARFLPTTKKGNQSSAKRKRGTAGRSPIH